MNLKNCSNTWKILDLGSLLHWLCKILQVPPYLGDLHCLVLCLSVSNHFKFFLSPWKSQDLTVFTKVHNCKLSITLKFLDSVYFCIIRLFLAISQNSRNIVWKPLMMHEKKFYHWEFWGVRNFFFNSLTDLCI